MNNELRWDQVRYFVAVARAGSAAAAARQLGVSHATLIRNIAQLEARLGLRLFDHVRSGYRITAEGEDVLASARGMEEHAEALLRRATGRNPTPEGLLKLVVSDVSLFDPMPLLVQFHRHQPRIALALEDGDGAAETRLAELQADVAILVTNSPPEALVGRQLGRVELAWFAAPARAAREEALRPEDCGWIVWTLAGSTELDDAWYRSVLRRLTGRPRVVLQADKHADALAAVRAGVGAALLSKHAGRGLQRLPFPEPRETFGVWLLTHPDLRRSGRVRALFEFVAEVHSAPVAPPR